MTAADGARPSRWARWRVALRLARRQAWRAKGSSALVMLLVMLPVAALVGAAVTVQSHIPSREQTSQLELGRNQAWLQVAGGPDPSRVQAPDQPYNATVAQDDKGDPVNPVLPAPTDPAAVLPAGTRTIPVAEQVRLFVKTATGVAGVSASAGPVWDPIFDGRYTIMAGRAPANDREAMVTPGILHRLGVQIGGVVEAADSDDSWTITGTIRRMDQSPDDTEVFLPSSAIKRLGGFVRWFTPDWQPTAADLPALNHAGFTVYGHDLVVDPPGGPSSDDSGSRWALLSAGAAAAVFCGYLVVLLAGAAFAVAARRQQRSLAVTSSVGANRSDVFRIVTLQGTVLGTTGGLVGALVGAGLAAAFLSITDNGVVSSFWGNWGFQVPWPVVGGILLFAVVVGTLSALAPARTATKGDILGALRSARRPARLNPRRPVFGLVLMILGIAATVAGGVLLGALNLEKPIDYTNPLRHVATGAIIFGPISFQIGFLFAGHWVLIIIARNGARLGIASRLATRDTAANPSRAVPAFAAIAVCVFLASMVLSGTAMSAAAGARNYSWEGPLGSIQATVYSVDEKDSARVRAAMADLLAPTNPKQTIAIDTLPEPALDPQTGDPISGRDAVWMTAEPCEHCGETPMISQGGIAVIDPDDLEALFGTDLPPSTRDAFRDGAALSVNPWGSLVQHGKVALSRWTVAASNEYQQKVQDAMDGTIPASELPKPEREAELPGIAVALAHPMTMLSIVIAPATAQSLGMTTVPSELVAVYAKPASDATVDALTAAASGVRLGSTGGVGVRVERGPETVSPWLGLILGVAGVLVIGASAVSLALARFERRPDDASLAAVGAGRSIRRRVNAWQAVVIAGIGTVVGTIAGLIPAWGVVIGAGDSGMKIEDAPWPWLAMLALGLPILIAVVNWIVPPRHPDLTRRTAIA